MEQSFRPSNSVTETELFSELQIPPPLQEVEEPPQNNLIDSEASREGYERPDHFSICLPNFNAKNRARMTISGSKAYPPDIYLIANKDFEDEDGFFKYDVQAYRGVPTSKEGNGVQLVDSEIGLGLFDSRDRLKTFIEDNPEIRQAAQKLGGNIEPVNQQYGYGFMICKYPEHETRRDEFVI